MKLNDQQQVSFDTLDYYVRHDSSGNVAAELFGTTEPIEQSDFMLLEGYAGTGKSTVIAQLLENFLGNRIGKIAISAPTNKAVRVLEKMSPIQDRSLRFGTIHSLCALKEQIDTRTGKRSYVPDDYLQKELPIGGIKLFIVDESSMLHDTLYDAILKYSRQYGFKVIFVGDPCQLPPIGNEERQLAKCFIPMIQRKDKIGVLKLDEVVRQAAENPIIAFSMAIRNNQPMPIFTDAQKEGIENIPFSKEALTNLFLKYFKCDAFDQDSGYAKVLAYRNETVNQYNHMIRQIIYEQDNPVKIITREKLIADTPVVKNLGGKPVIIFSTSQEMEVLEIVEDNVNSNLSYRLWEHQTVIYETEEHVLQDYDSLDPYMQSIANDETSFPKTLKKWGWVVKNVPIRVYKVIVCDPIELMNPEKHYEIEIVHEDSEKLYESSIKSIKDNAVACKEHKIKGFIWREYYNAQNIFANTKYNYAITVHKAQGSGYDFVFMNEWDIKAAFNKSEVVKLRYVAATRAKTKLFIIDK